MIGKWFKRVVWLLLALLLLVMMLAYYLLYTQSGSQWLINHVISRYQIPLTYQSLAGHLAGSLQLKGLRYHSPQLQADVGQLSYQLEWSLWHRSVDFVTLSLSDVVIKPVTAAAEVETTSAVTEDHVLPFDLHVEQLLIEGVQLIQDDQVHQLDAILAQASWQQAQIQIQQLQIKHPAAQMTLAGHLGANQEWPFALTTTGRWQDPTVADRIITGTGTWQGNVAGLQGQQRIEINDGLVQGEVLVNAVIELNPEPQIEVEFESTHALAFDTPNGSLEAVIEPSTWRLSGSTHQLDLNSQLAAEQWPAGQLRVQASGELTSQLEGQLQWQTVQSGSAEPDGERLDANFSLDLNDNMGWAATWQLQRFNPAAWGIDAPGHISGAMDWQGSVSGEQWEVALLHSELSGSLFDQPLKLGGGGRYSGQAVTAEQLQLLLGDNELMIDGDLSPQSMDLTIQVSAADLGHFQQGVSGDLNGEVVINGVYQQPVVRAQMQSAQLGYEDLKLRTIEWSANGTWGQSLDVDLTVAAGQIKRAEFSDLILSWRGWLESHQVNLALQTEEFASQVTLAGRYLNTATGPTWQGTLNDHVLQLTEGQAIHLSEPAQIAWGEGLSLSTLCWTGVAEGQLCIQSDHIKADQSLTGSLQMNQFSVQPFHALLPEPFNIKGYINGTANYVFNEAAVELDARLALDDGHIQVSNAQGLLLDQRIQTLELTAQNSDNQVKGQLQLLLADTSQLQWQGVLSRADEGAEWTIESTLEGHLVNPSFIKEISSEISEIDGLIELNGEVSGLVSGPRLLLALVQPDGHLKLTRMGTRIEQLKLGIDSLDTKPKLYALSLSGQHLLPDEAGELNLQGELDLNLPWRFNGQLTGQQFRVINLPELSLDISPQLAVVATEQSATITGVLDLPYGHVVIKTLPPEAVNNSNDLVVIRDEPEALSSADTYEVLLDVQARIVDVVKLDVIGLQANLIGDLQIKQGAKQQPQGYGELSLQDGTYQIYGQKLNIETGELYFSGSLDNPRLNVIVSRKATVDPVKAGVRLGGTVDNLQSELFSEPAMTDVEKLAYIMTGQGINTGGQLDSESLKQTAILLGLSQSSPIFNQIQQQFGIDVLTVKRNGPQSESVIEAGKQINDRLYVSYNQGLFNRLGFWVLKYRINQYLNLQSTQGEDQSIELVYTRKSNIKKPKEPSPKQ